MSEQEYRANPRQTLGVLVPAAVLLAVGLGLASLFWMVWLVATFGVLLILGSSLVCLIMLYRLIVRPVMVRVDAGGIYLKRLAVTIPWDALARMERLDFKGKTYLSLVERETHHPIFDDQALLLGAAMNQRLGLPGLVVDLPGLGEPADQVIMEIEEIAPIPLIR